MKKVEMATETSQPVQEQTKPVGFWEAFWFWVKLGEALQHLVDSQGFPFGRGKFMVYHVGNSLVFRRDPPAANLGSALLTARTYNSRN